SVVNPGAWTRNVASAASGRIDVTSLMQARVNSALYCGADEFAGNTNVAFRIRAASGVRRAYSFENDSEKAPYLFVRYTAPTGTTCKQLRRSSSIASVNDDASQSGTANNVLNADTTRLRTTEYAGLRFGNVQIPQGATITEAWLTLTPSASQTTAAARGTVTIKAIDTVDAPTFNSTAAGRISGLATVGSTVWTPSAWTSGVETSSGNIASLLQTLVNRPTWASGNAVGLTLTGSLTSGGPVFKTYGSSNVSSLPRLTVVFKTTDPAAGVYTSRQAIIDTINNLSFSGGTPLNESYFESARYMMGQAATYGRGYLPAAYTAQPYPDVQGAMNAANVYQSPVGEATCQSNNIIMLTDGLPSVDSDQVSMGTLCAAPANVGTVDGNSNTINSFACMANTAKFLAETGRNGSSIKTYTIGFGPVTANPNGMAALGLKDVAQKGQGEFFAASNSESLAASFQSIFSRIADTNGTMAAPGVAVNQINRSQHLDQLYYGVFKPEKTKRWPGNVKRYRLGLSGSTDAILDTTGANAIDSDTKFFSVNARSWWSDEVDGNKAEKGGAASKQTAARTIYVDSGVAGALTLLNNATPPTGLTTDDVKWIQGIDVDDENLDGSTTDMRKSMGSPIHAQPTLVSYGAGDEDFVVFVGTNDGLLHSINVNNGTENWAWMPSDLLGNIPVLRTNPGIGVGGKPLYGLDGNWTVVTLGKGASVQRFLVGGMRQGGSNLYSLKLPSAKAGAPTLQWVIKPSMTDFANLGYTWSQPVQTRVRVGGVEKDVLVFGGGLDYDKYEEGGSTALSTGGDLGRQVYMVDASTGSVVWMATNAGTTSPTRNNVAAMKYSVPGQIRVVDKDFDRLADHLYFGDAGGQIFRVDIDNSSSAPKLVKRVNLLAQLGNAAEPSPSKPNDRRFYETPAVAYALDGDNKLYAAVAMGSGNRNYPVSDKDVQERFFVIKDYDAARFDTLKATEMTEAGAGSGGVPDLVTRTNPIRIADLANVTTTTGAAATTAVAAKKGWYINIGGAGRLGEKVLSSAFIFSRDTASGLVYEVSFNSFVPDSGAAVTCSPVGGTTTAWSLLLANGSASRDLNGDGTLDRFKDGVATGITGSDVGLIRPDSTGNLKLKKLTGTGVEDSGDIPDGFGRILRTRWYDQQ
ncbi:MAG: PilC/PilY family type IV pilus protein, partial [Moraxellaceae bacterium]|nr:PilC/PilY family type IV pilus protein [Moraxellaceae bacterium]